MQIELIIAETTTYTFTKFANTILFSVAGEAPTEINPDTPFEDIDNILKGLGNMDARTAKVLTSLYYNAPYLDFEDDVVPRAIMDHMVLHLLNLLDLPELNRNM